jgi:hypothetical protein
MHNKTVVSCKTSVLCCICHMVPEVCPILHKNQTFIINEIDGMVHKVPKNKWTHENWNDGMVKILNFDD